MTNEDALQALPELVGRGTRIPRDGSKLTYPWVNAQPSDVEFLGRVTIYKMVLAMRSLH